MTVNPTTGEPAAELPALAFGFSLFRFQGATEARTDTAGVGAGLLLKDFPGRIAPLESLLQLPGALGGAVPAEESM
jgi:hypothetical protein